MTSAGEALVRGVDDGGECWFLCGAAVHCGDGLDLAMEGDAWLRVRFEVCYPATFGIDPRDLMPTPSRFPVVHIPVEGGDPSIRVTDHMRFRWREEKA